MMVAVAVVGVMLGIGLSRLDRWSEDQRAKAAARSVADLLQRARAGAIRTGNRHVVFFGNPGVADPSGNAVERGGAWVPVLLIDDGAPAAANCAIDAGEPIEAVQRTPARPPSTQAGPGTAPPSPIRTPPRSAGCSFVPTVFPFPSWERSGAAEPWAPRAAAEAPST
jgi:type II secretory pathway pseudopilin PulG